MRRKHFDRIPNLSLLSGYFFIFFIMVLFGYVQYSSSVNLKEIDTEMRNLSCKLVDSNETSLPDIILEYNAFLHNTVFSNLEKTFDKADSFYLPDEISSREDMITSLKTIGKVYDQYESDLYRSQTILLMTFIVLSVILAILLAVSEFDQVKKLEHEKSQRLIDQKLMDVLESEKNLIAIELHDDVAQKLSILSQHFESSGSAEHTEILKRYNKDVIHKIRTMAQSLRSPDFRGLTFQEQLEFLYSDFRSITDIKLKTSCNGLSVLQLSDDMKLHIYRIIQELLTNCRKHSKASSVEINLLYAHPILKLRYEDNGIGMSGKSEGRGLGLRSIVYRLNILGGSITRNSDNGLYAEIVIPGI